MSLTHITIREGLLYLAGIHADIELGDGYLLPDGKPCHVGSIGLHDRKIAESFHPEVASLEECDMVTSVAYSPWRGEPFPTVS